MGAKTRRLRRAQNSVIERSVCSEPSDSASNRRSALACSTLRASNTTLGTARLASNKASARPTGPPPRMAIGFTRAASTRQFTDRPRPETVWFATRVKSASSRAKLIGRARVPPAPAINLATDSARTCRLIQPRKQWCAATAATYSQRQRTNAARRHRCLRKSSARVRQDRYVRFVSPMSPRR